MPQTLYSLLNEAITNAEESNVIEFSYNNDPELLRHLYCLIDMILYNSSFKSHKFTEIALCLLYQHSKRKQTLYSGIEYKRIFGEFIEKNFDTLKEEVFGLSSAIKPYFALPMNLQAKEYSKDLHQQVFYREHFKLSNSK